MLEEKIEQIRTLFASTDQKYEKIIELGRSTPPLDPQYKNPETLVSGCQSQVYLHSYLKDEKIYYEAESDALISAGLVRLLIDVYSEETPETILKHEPKYLEELGIYASLSPSRSNGLANIHLRMKQDALKLLLNRQSEQHAHHPQG